jgi:hypothetical protein
MFSKVAGVQVVPTDATSIGVRRTKGLSGGMVSAQGQSAHSPAAQLAGTQSLVVAAALGQDLQGAVHQRERVREVGRATWIGREPADEA